MAGTGALRARAATALAGLGPVDDDWPVHDGPVDSVTPPCFVLVWPDPWLLPRTVCAHAAQLQVVCVAARIDPTPGYLELEALADAALPALQTAGFGFVQTSGPAPFEIGGITYQAARILVTQSVTYPEVP